jgi:hypothetical protein
MQFLAKCHSDYTRLKAMGQWKTTDPNSTIIMLQAQLDAVKMQFTAFQAATTKASNALKQQTNIAPITTANAANIPRPPSQKPSWKAANGQSEETEHNSKKWMYCTIFERWTQLHKTDGHAGPCPHIRQAAAAAASASIPVPMQASSSRAANYAEATGDHGDF